MKKRPASVAAKLDPQSQQVSKKRVAAPAKTTSTSLPNVDEILDVLKESDVVPAQELQELSSSILQAVRKRRQLQTKDVEVLHTALGKVEDDMQRDIDAAQKRTAEGQVELSLARSAHARARAQLEEMKANEDANEAEKVDVETTEQQTQQASKNSARILQQLQAEQDLSNQKLSTFREGPLTKFDQLVCAVLKVSVGDRGRAPKEEETLPNESGYEWIRHGNGEPDRRARRDIAELSRRAIRCGGYAFGDARAVRLRSIREMIAGTCLISPTLGNWPRKLRRAACRATEISPIDGLVLQVAALRCRSGRRVVALNAASSYHCGGGFLTGGRHAMEESFCVQSTLYQSLEHATKLAEKVRVSVPECAQPPKPYGGGDWHAHIPEDGVVLSPFVEVFRGSTDEGYPFEDNPFKLEAAVSVAMPNCNGRMTDSPVDANADNDVYMEQLDQKWRSALMAAAHYTAADCLIVPDAGCGVFRNSPESVGSSLGNVLRNEFSSHFKEVLLVFPGADKTGTPFVDAVRAAYSDTKQADIPVNV